MLKRLLACFLAAASLVAAAPQKPKLILAIVIDQFRYDYLTRFRAEYHGGFDRLLNQGAVFTNARYEHFPTVTAIGHSTFLSGATPAISGIIGNDWYDRQTGKSVTSVSDSNTQLLGGGPNRPGSSPRRMLVDTIGDELKMETRGKARVIGISLKDRAAILPAGHMADGAFWFDTASGSFVSSTFYFPDLPAWVKDFDAGRPADQYRGAKWLDRTMTQDLRKLYGDVDASPFGNELVERFAERAMQAEQLGKRGVTDLLAVSFSANDYVGHQLGPDSPEVHEMCLRTDRLLATFFAAVDKAVGMQNVLVVLTADHGIAPIPEVNAQRRMPGGRMPSGEISRAVQAALTAKYGEGNWIVSSAEYAIYLNVDLIAQKKLKRAEVNETAAEAALNLPHVFRVYTREQLMGGAALDDHVGRRVMNGYYVRRGPDVEVLLEPYWVFTSSGASHGTTFDYDTHVPVIFMGAGIRPHDYDGNIAPNDIAPTLATLLGIETPSGSVGRVLTEMW
jgi:predicted AlkP superfamily pyrophosphatase or phosphodiesterase